MPWEQLLQDSNNSLLSWEKPSPKGLLVPLGVDKSAFSAQTRTRRFKNTTFLPKASGTNHFPEFWNSHKLLWNSITCCWLLGRKNWFFFPSEQGWSRMTHREVFLSFPRLLSRLFLTRDPPGRTLRARWVTSGGSAEVTSSKITRDGLRRSHSHCFGINHPGSCSGNRSEPGTCHGELRAWRDLAKFGQGEGSWCFSWVSSWVG